MARQPQRILCQRGSDEKRAVERIPGRGDLPGGRQLGGELGPQRYEQGSPIFNRPPVSAT